MNAQEKAIVKTLNKVGVDTRFVSLYKNGIYINNLKFSKFSRKKEEKFRQEYPEIEVHRSKLFQKICIKVSRTIKDQIKPQSKLFIANDNSLENILLYILMEPYKRKYGIKIVENHVEDAINVSDDCMDDFCLEYINLMKNGKKIENNEKTDTIYPLKHVNYRWIREWIESTNITYTSNKEYEDDTKKEIINFLEKHIPNVQESIIQSVNYLEQNNQ